MNSFSSSSISFVPYTGPPKSRARPAQPNLPEKNVAKALLQTRTQTSGDSPSSQSDPQKADQITADPSNDVKKTISEEDLQHSFPRPSGAHRTQSIIESGDRVKPGPDTIGEKLTAAVTTSDIPTISAPLVPLLHINNNTASEESDHSMTSMSLDECLAQSADSVKKARSTIGFIDQASRESHSLNSTLQTCTNADQFVAALVNSNANENAYEVNQTISEVVQEAAYGKKARLDSQDICIDETHTGSLGSGSKYPRRKRKFDFAKSNSDQAQKTLRNQRPNRTRGLHFVPAAKDQTPATRLGNQSTLHPRVTGPKRPANTTLGRGTEHDIKEHWEVKEIVGHEVSSQGELFYHVRWADTWEPSSHLEDARDAIKEYHAFAVEAKALSM